MGLKRMFELPFGPFLTHTSLSKRVMVVCAATCIFLRLVDISHDLFED